MIINFPWPPSDLSPNARIHWAKKAKAFKAYKHTCVWMAQKTLPQGKYFLPSFFRFKITFYPPDKRRYDRDNLIARFKAGQDALSFLTGVDDHKFEVTYALGAPVAHGQVTVEVLG